MHTGLSGSTAVHSLEVVQESRVHCYKRYNWQCAGTKLVVYTACIEGCQVQEHYCMQYILHIAEESNIGRL